MHPTGMLSCFTIKLSYYCLSKWNLIRLCGPSHEMVTKTVHKTTRVDEGMSLSSDSLGVVVVLGWLGI